jgi:hypothetical protein
VDGQPTHKVTGNPWKATSTYKGEHYKRSFIKQVLQLQQPTTKQERMSIFQYAGKHYLRNKDGAVHSTRYPSREAAAQAAHKMASGLITFRPTLAQVQTFNHTNIT